MNKLSDDDDYGHNGIENGNIILYGDHGQSHHGGGYGGGYEEYGSHDDYGNSGSGYGHGGYIDHGSYGGQVYPSYSGPVGGGGYGHGGRSQHDFIEYQGPSGYGIGGGGGYGGGGYGGGYGYQRPLQLLKIIKEDEPEGIFDTFLSFFDIGFEPFILLLGLAGIGAAAVLFSAITNAGRRSIRRRILNGRNWLEQLSDQQQEYMEEIHENVVRGNKWPSYCK